jgi:transposase
MTVLLRCHVNYVHCVMLIMSLDQLIDSTIPASLTAFSVYSTHCLSGEVVHRRMTASRYGLDSLMDKYIIRLTLMQLPETSKPRRTIDPKAEVLRRQGALHPNPRAVRDEAFRQEEFFDPRDLVQVRYEMLRRHQVDGDTVTEVATAFGVSRQAYYMTEAAFEEKGVAGLLPRRRGPRRAHKCTDEILDFAEQWRADSSAEKDVSKAVQKRFGVSIHPRSIARALSRRKKKRR